MFLKAAAHIISAPVTRLFNMSLQLSEFPIDWKSAIIFPLFKGGSESDLNCYCPISILPCLAKVLEKLIQKQLNDFLDKNCILFDMQSGFWTRHGCITATTKVLDDVITALDSKQVCTATFIDLAKAFDYVDHRILLYKLSSIGLSSSSCDWFANYLTNCVQQLKVENIMSDPFIISKVLSQGSILGPTIFSYLHQWYSQSCWHLPDTSLCRWYHYVLSWILSKFCGFQS